MPDDSTHPLIHPDTSPAAPVGASSTMDNLDLTAGNVRRKGRVSWVLTLSYAFDWVVLVVFAVVGAILGNLTPNKRPFSLNDPDISFPFTVKETVPVWLLVILAIILPIVVVAAVSLIFVPGATVPKGTPKSLIWRRKLWELHTGWLGLALSIVAAWFITNGMKNLFGKPRPDLLSRCQPDLDNLSQYIIDVFKTAPARGQLVSPTICKNTDKSTLDDGFRSYPSGHSSSSAAGLIYLSLFIASKFAITIPFLAPAGFADASAFAAFPSRTRLSSSVNATGPDTYELPSRNGSAPPPPPPTSTLDASLGNKGIAHHNKTVSAIRRQAAAPPVYLLCIALAPFFLSIFISGSRWWDFRHHGFDILFGYLIGTLTAIFAFRYYHLPISQGAGWAWGPRSHDKAFWGGVGSFSYATDRLRGEYRYAGGGVGDEEEALGHGSGLSTVSPAAVGAAARKSPNAEDRNSGASGSQ